jgi:multiple sugar transport system permease protein
MEAARVPATEAPKLSRRERKQLSERARAERRLAWMLCAPAVIVMLIVTGYPIGYAIWLSLQRYDLRFPDDKEFVGLANYRDVLTSTTWWSDVWNTVIITVGSVALELVLGMAIALVMHRAIFGRGPVRAAVLIPYGIVTVVAAFGWRYAFDPASGFVQGLPLISDSAAPLTERGGSLIVIILTETWKTTPFMALLILAGLQVIPDDVYEAAKVDGSTVWQRFTKITLPLLKPAILVALIFRTLDALRIFDLPFVLTKGAFGTNTLSLLAYQDFRENRLLGLGSAVAILTFITVMFVSFIYIRFVGGNIKTLTD